MRVVSGNLRGMKSNTIDGDSTRPTREVVKEALFKALTSTSLLPYTLFTFLISMYAIDDHLYKNINLSLNLYITYSFCESNSIKYKNKNYYIHIYKIMA